ncbi:hypothetical protein UlMin_045112 [Ulmus minor]
MSAIFASQFPTSNISSFTHFSSPSKFHKFPSLLPNFFSYHHPLTSSPREFVVLSSSKFFVAEKLFRTRRNPLYSHSLPCIEAWFRSLGFYQSEDDIWLTEKKDWHAELSDPSSRRHPYSTNLNDHQNWNPGIPSG